MDFMVLGFNVYVWRFYRLVFTVYMFMNWIWGLGFYVLCFYCLGFSVLLFRYQCLRFMVLLFMLLQFKILDVMRLCLVYVILGV